MPIPLYLMKWKCMYVLPKVTEVYSVREMQNQILSVHNSLAEFYTASPDELFNVQPIPDGWTIRKNLQHTISVNNMAKILLNLWKPIYKILGKPKKQPTLEQILVSNRLNVSDYGYYPKEIQKSGTDKKNLITRLLLSAEKIKDSLNSKTENELEQTCSPFYGMNLKNFIYFVLKHNIHHANVVKNRLEY